MRESPPRPAVAIVLVDTSIWLEIERGRFELEGRLDYGEVAICPPIAQELLQGARQREHYTLVWHTIFATRMLDDPMPLETFEQAAQIYRDCRDDGYVIASP